MVARMAFFAELDRLRVAANKGRGPLSVQKIADGTGVSKSTLSGWFPAKTSKRKPTVPRDDDQLRTVIVFLLREAGVLKVHQGLDRRTWQYWLNRRDAADVADAPVASGRSFYTVKVREFIAPADGLRERETEWAMLTGFCAGPERYLWIRADPWAGKSALLSTFLLEPPSGVTVIGFFITDRAGESDHRAFTDAVLDQLKVLLPDQRETIEQEKVSRDGLCAEMLTTAAEREAVAKRRLILVVDGLDEDSGTPSIASLLPVRPHENLRVIVASRHGPEIPIPERHPLSAAVGYELGKSQFAAGLEHRARSELRSLLADPAYRYMVALITAAKGLTGREIAELTDLAPFEIDPLEVSSE
ncbi:hypothetical protein [Nocardia sp.]|uniref:hypothetical protein n=1 Tax=Nocardia sp. TaxID=1821 RepID=UPI00258AFC23|nr:hypothetical protein [Nocardia sp.]